MGEGGGWGRLGPGCAEGCRGCGGRARVEVRAKIRSERGYRTQGADAEERASSQPSGLREGESER